MGRPGYSAPVLLFELKMTRRAEAFFFLKSNTNASSENYVAYLWTSIQGYSQFGIYEGNGSEAGPFVYTGFKPEWILFKNLGAAEEWVLQDTTRNPINPVTKIYEQILILLKLTQVR